MGLRWENIEAGRRELVKRLWQYFKREMIDV